MRLKIITLISMAITLFLGITYVSVKEDGKNIREIVLEKNINKQDEVIKTQLGIYTPNKGLSKLERTEVSVNYTQNKSEIVKMVVENTSILLSEKELIKNNLTMINCFFAGGDLYVNLEESSDIQGDSKKTVYMLYSLTNSLVDLGGIERVKFLLNNKEGTGVFEQYYNKNTDI